MESRDNIRNELLDIAPMLETISRDMLYAVPEGYFEVFPITVLGQVLPKETMKVPEGYFEGLPDILLAKIKMQELANELDEVAPLLKNISRQMPNALPANYFETLQIAFPANEAKVIPINTNRRKTAVWAVAAVIVALAGMLSWSYFTQNNSTVIGNSELASTEVDFSDDSLSALDLANALAELEDKSLESELGNYGFADGNRSAIYYLSTVNIEKALQDISDEELAKNLKEQVLYGKKS